jgi:carbon-monoxide dehydrogenase medium subunit
MSIPTAFGYTRPESVDEALRILSTDEGAKVIAGGQSLLPLMKLRLAAPETLVDIGRLGELRGITKLDDGRLSVGALTTYAELIDSPAIHLAVLRDALPTIGDVQVRNLGTVGGAVAHADPASDLPAALLALNAELVLQSSSGTRTVPADGFFEGPFQTGARPDELLTEIILPAPRGDAGSAYVSLEQPASGYSIVGVAAVLITGAGGVVEYAGIGVTGVGDHPYRASEVEGGLVGTTATPDEVEAAAAQVVSGRTVNSDIHANAEYRAAMAAVYTRRAITAALARLR